jgi:hypothetical protein
MTLQLPRLPFGLDPLIAEAKRRMRRRRILLTGGLVVLVGVGVAAGISVRSSSPGPGSGGPSGPGASFGGHPAAQGMASVFMRPSAGPVPASIARAAASFNEQPTTGSDGALEGPPPHPGKVRVRQGRLLLAGLGPSHHAIYAFPTSRGGVCLVISGPGRAGLAGRLGMPCIGAFGQGRPVVVTTLDMCIPTEACSPTQLAGLTEDGVTGVRVLLNGKPERAVLRNDAWYYRFPSNRISDRRATKLLVSLADGRSITVPIPIRRLETGG